MKSKKTFLGIALSFVLGLSLLTGINAQTWTYGINKVTNNETENWSTLRFYYDGRMVIYPSYSYLGKQNAVQGYIRYSGGSGGDTGRLYTPMAASTNQGGTLSVSRRYYDTYVPFRPKTKFNFGFTWLPTGTQPRSIEQNDGLIEEHKLFETHH